MEIQFKKVHTVKDLAISVLIIIVGAGLFFVDKGLGFCIAVVGLVMLALYKSGYKKNGQGPVLTRKSEELCRSCRSSIIEFLNGKDTNPVIKPGNEGGSIRLVVYYNEKEDVAYIQLSDYSNYTYVPVTDVVELKIDRASKIISKL